MCAQRRLRSAWASAQSDQNLCCVLNGYLRTQAFFMRTAKTLIRLGGCQGWSVFAGWACHFVGYVVCWRKRHKTIHTLLALRILTDLNSQFVYSSTFEPREMTIWWRQTLLNPRTALRRWVACYLCGLGLLAMELSASFILGDNSVTAVLPPFWKGSTLKQMEFAPC